MFIRILRFLTIKGINFEYCLDASNLMQSSAHYLYATFKFKKNFSLINIDSKKYKINLFFNALHALISKLFPYTEKKFKFYRKIIDKRENKFLTVAPHI